MGEEVNIWTHIIGAAFAFYFLYRLCVYDYREGIMNLLMPLVYDFSFGYSLALSAIFHGFNCIDEHTHYKLRIADFCGIGVGILGSCAVLFGSLPLSTFMSNRAHPEDILFVSPLTPYFFSPIVYYTFACSPLSLWFWESIVAILFPLFLWMPFATFFHDKRNLRTMLFVVAALIPLFSMAQFWIMNGIGHHIESIFFTRILETYVYYGLGIMFYVTRIPERFWPGLFDHFGASHQLWHILCAWGMYTIHVGVYAARDLRVSDWTCQLYH